MGIDSFRRVINNLFGKCKIEKIPDKVSSLFIDCNGIFHKTKTDIYLDDLNKYTDQERIKISKIGLEELEIKHIKAIISTLDDLLIRINPNKNFILAPDGIANAAKMNQQKSRRYIKVKEIDNETILIDSNAITPGTDLMFNIDNSIRKWLGETKNLPEKTIYSSHLVKGEGEHKNI